MIENKVKKYSIQADSQVIHIPYLPGMRKKIIIINMSKVIEDHGEFHQKTGIYKRESMEILELKKN